MNKTTALAMIANDSDSLASMPEELKDDPEIVLAACCEDSTAMTYASDRLKNDRAFALVLAQHRLTSIEFMTPQIKDDTEVVLQTLTNNGHALEYVSDRLKADSTMLRVAFNQLGSDITFTSDENVRLLTRPTQ